MLRRNVVRVAAACRSGPAAAVCKAANCCCTSGGHCDDRAADLRKRGLKRRRVAAFRGDAAQLQQSRQIVRLRLQNLLDQLLKFRVAARAALALDFLRQLIRRPKFCGLISTALRQSAIASAELPRALSRIPSKSIDLIVFRSEIARALQSLRGHVEISLAQRQHSPVGPPCRFARCELRHLRSLLSA